MDIKSNTFYGEMFAEFVQFMKIRDTIPAWIFAAAERMVKSWMVEDEGDYITAEEIAFIIWQEYQKK